MKSLFRKLLVIVVLIVFALWSHGASASDPPFVVVLYDTLTGKLYVRSEPMARRGKAHIHYAKELGLVKAVNLKEANKLRDRFLGGGLWKGPVVNGQQVVYLHPYNSTTSISINRGNLDPKQFETLLAALKANKYRLELLPEALNHLAINPKKAGEFFYEVAARNRMPQGAVLKLAVAAQPKVPGVSLRSIDPLMALRLGGYNVWGMDEEGRPLNPALHAQLVMTEQAVGHLSLLTLGYYGLKYGPPVVATAAPVVAKATTAVAAPVVGAALSPAGVAITTAGVAGGLGVVAIQEARLLEAKVNERERYRKIEQAEAIARDIKGIHAPSTDYTEAWLRGVRSAFIGGNLPLARTRLRLVFQGLRDTPAHNWIADQLLKKHFGPGCPPPPRPASADDGW